MDISSIILIVIAACILALVLIDKVQIFVKWLKKAMADKKITKEEVKELEEELTGKTENKKEDVK